MRAALTVVGLVMMIASGALPARGTDASEILGRVGEHYRGVGAIAAEFIQKERLATMGGVRESRGTVVLQRPGRMRWEYQGAEPQTIVSDGEFLWVHHPGEKTAYKFRFGEEEMSRSPLSLLFRGDATLSAYFAAKGVESPTVGVLRLELAPRDGDGTIRSVSLLVREADGTLLGAAHQDVYGNRTEIEFQQVREEPEIAPGLFVFAPPPETRILAGQGLTGP